MEEKVCKETAEQDFGRMVETIGIDVGGMNEQELEYFNSTKRKFIRMIQIGKMEVNDDGMPVLNTRTPDVPKLTFKMPNGDVLIAQGRVLNGNEHAGMRAMIAESTGVPPKLVSIGVTGRDFLLAEKIINFLLVD